MRWKWQNRQRFDKDKRRPISGRRCPAKSILLKYSNIILFQSFIKIQLIIGGLQSVRGEPAYPS